jgi:hypothetical protein
LYCITYISSSILDTEYLMSFREKGAWISALSLLAVYGYYFWIVWGAALAGGAGSLHFGALLIQSIVLLIVIQIVLSIAVAVWKPKEAAAALDERERLIDLKATSRAYYIVIAGALVMCIRAQMEQPVFYVTNGLFFTVVLAQFVKSVTQIVYYRIGA